MRDDKSDIDNKKEVNIMSDIRKIPNNPSLTGLARFYKDVKFASPEGVDLYMQIMAPWFTENDETSVNSIYPRQRLDFSGCQL